MIAVFHTEQPDGRYRATCETYPSWECEADTFKESFELAQESLLAHIATCTLLVHYIVPDANQTLRAA